MKAETRDRFLEFCKKEHFDISSLESKQREAVLSDEKYVIPAGAGSGKTTVLTYRFLRLLIDEDIAPIHSDEILTMTFTKAATANMKARIYKALKVAEKDKLIGEEEIERFTNAEICTTDSFCSKIVRLDAIRYGLTPDFRIEDDDEYDKWADRNIRNLVLENIVDQKCQNLVSILGPDNLTQALKKIGKSYFSFPSPIPGKEEMGDMLYSSFVERTKEEIEKRENGFVTLSQEFINLLSEEEKAQEDVSLVSKALNEYRENGTISPIPFSSKRKVSADGEKNTRYLELKKEIKSSINELSLLYSYSGEENNYIRAWGVLLSSFYTLLSHHKREEGVLTFRDVMLISLDILKTNREIRTSFASRFKRIMVDEFQDNNGYNKKLIYLLAAKPSYDGSHDPEIDDIDMRKIFMVGDEKQSIYRFRGADVSVFKNIAKDFGEDRVLSLSENYRSEEPVINRINKMFESNIMSNYPTEDYEARYKCLDSHVNKVSSSQMKFLWLDWNSAKQDEDRNLKTDAHLTEAYGVASFIKNEIMANGEKWPVSTSLGGERKPEYSDIAILLRKGSNQSDYEKALRHFNIPFNVSENKSLTMDAVVNDFYNALSLIVYGLEDELSFASYLRSPFASLSDEGVKRVLENKRNDLPLSLSLKEEDAISLDFSLETIEGAKSIAKKGRITPILSYLWLDRGYRYFIEGKEENAVYTEHYDYLFALSSSFDSDNRTLVDLLDRIRPILGLESNLKDISVLEESTQGVTIQTIHKSKGLEYPIVFVSDTGGGNRNNSIDIVEDTSGLPTIPFIYLDAEDKMVNPWRLYMGSDEDLMENAEAKRILYVALTRARHHLVLTGAFTNESDPDSKSKSKNLLYYIAKGLGFSFQYQKSPKKRIGYSCAFFDTPGLGKPWAFEEKEIFPVYLSVFKERGGKKKRNIKSEKWYEDIEERKEVTECEKCGVTTLIDKEDYSSSLLPLSRIIKDKDEKGVVIPKIKVDEILSQVESMAMEGKSVDEVRESRITEFGTLVHKTIEDRIRGEKEDYSAFFKNDKKRDEIIDAALSLRDGFFASSFFNETLKSFTLHPERSFMVMDGNRIVEGIVDLLCEKEDEIYIVDYKTDTYILESEHKNQLNYYKAALKTIYPDKKIRAFVFYLRAPERVLMID